MPTVDEAQIAGMSRKTVAAELSGNSQLGKIDTDLGPDWNEMGVADCRAQIKVPRRNFDRAAEMLPIGNKPTPPYQRSILRGRMYEREKKRGGSEPGTNRRDGVASAQSEHLQKTAEALAEQHNVSPATIRRDAKRFKAIEELERPKAEARAKASV